MTRIVDNKKDTLADLLNRELADTKEVAVATAYFNIRGFNAIATGLDDKPMKLLLGREPQESKSKPDDEILKEVEENEDSADYFNMLQQVIQYFKDEKREVKKIEGRFFHGKTFIAVSPSLTDVKTGIGVVGSSNFTYGGLVSNRELNVLLTDREVIKELSEWFLEQWSTALDYKDEFLTLLQNYTSAWSPYEVIAKALYETYYRDLLEDRDRNFLKRLELYPHQYLTFINAKEKLEKYKGVIIADSTGLGKSRVALAIAQDMSLNKGTRTLLIAPKAILETSWKDEIKRSNINMYIEECSTEMLSQNPDVIKKYIEEEEEEERERKRKRPWLIIIDEAHYFRRPSTNRYKALQELNTKTKTKNDAYLVLLTATPVNTGIMDLCHLLALYLPDNILIKLGLANNMLRNYFSQREKELSNGKPINMDDVLQEFLVRHSRMLARTLSKDIKFPERVFDDKIKQYPIRVSLREIYDMLERLNLAPYDLTLERLNPQFRLPDGSRLPLTSEKEKIEQLKELCKVIFRVGLFKRLESSYEAYKLSLERLVKYLKTASSYAQSEGIFLPSRMRGDILRLLEEDEEDEDREGEDGEGEREGKATVLNMNSRKIAQLFKQNEELRERCRLEEEEKKEFIRKCEEDIKIIEELLKKLPDHDDKYTVLEERLHALMPLKDRNGVIIFTEYFDTAEYLYKRLRNTFKKVMLVTGRDSYYEGERSKKADVVNTFQKKGGILVSTDVLAAGQNLQNAQYVINYDFPWNPVVLIQRIGRVDRIGSQHDRVYLINILPKNNRPDDPESLEYFLELMKRLYVRLTAIRETIGLDASTLGEAVVPKDYSIQMQIARNDPTVLKFLEEQVEQFTKSPQDYLVEIIQQQGEEWLKSIPTGIGAIKKADFEGIFVLFVDTDTASRASTTVTTAATVDTGTTTATAVGKRNFYWYFKNYDSNEELTSPLLIVEKFLSDKAMNASGVSASVGAGTMNMSATATDGRGERLPYDQIIPRLLEAKHSIMKRLEEQKRKEATFDVNPDKKVNELCEELRVYGDEGEELAARLRTFSNDRNIVDRLWRARNENRLIDEARALLPAKNDMTLTYSNNNAVATNIRLKRVCWCYFKKVN